MAHDWMLTEDEIRQMRLMVWLVEESEGDIPDPVGFYGDDSAYELARRDVQALAARGLVRPWFSGGASLTSLSMGLEPEGRRVAASVRQMWDDRGKRRLAARTAVVAWLYDQDAIETPSASISLQGIHTSPYGTFYGDLLSGEEVDRASAWLRRHELIDGSSVAQFDGPVRAYLTDGGVRCAEQCDGDATAYVEAQRSQQTGQGQTVWNVNGQVQYATGDHARQVINVGQTADDLALALRGLAELVRRLGLSVPEDELDALAEEAARDLAGERPTGQPTKRFLDRMRAVVGRAGDTALTSAVTLGVNAAASDLTALLAGLG